MSTPNSVVSDELKKCAYCNREDRLLIQALSPWDNHEMYVCFVCLHTTIADMVIPQNKNEVDRIGTWEGNPKLRQKFGHHVGENEE